MEGFVKQIVTGAHERLGDIFLLRNLRVDESFGEHFFLFDLGT